jgi:hypothetical protein
MNNKKIFLDNYFSRIFDSVLGKLDKDTLVSSVDLKIKATHAGKVNGNNVLYTPRSMRQGVTTLTKPFVKHLQKGHNGEAAGPITAASYLDYTEQYPELANIADNLETAKSDKDLVKAVKELTSHPTYKNNDFKGLGATEVYATIYDSDVIEDLRTGESKGQVSIGGKSNRVLCSICSEHMKPDHKHKKGNTYDSETCFAIYDVMMLDHIGFVSDPADNETSSIIISDSIDLDVNITIENYKIQDNIQRNQSSMFKIEQLKALVKDPTQFIGILNLTEAKSKEVEDTYKQSLKYTRDSNYLIPSEKLLPINTELNVALSKLAIDKLDDSTEKTELLDLLKVHLDSKFKDLPLEDFLVDIAKVVTAEEVVEKITGTAPEGATAAKEVVEKVVEPEVSLGNSTSLSDSDLDRIVSAITSKVTEAIKPALETTSTGIQDSLSKDQYSLLLDRNKALENDIKTVETTITQLTNDYREVIMSQILEKKSLNKTSPYYTEVLAKRELQGLKDTLLDLSFSAEIKVATVETPAVVAEIEKVNIQDSLSKDLVEQESKKQETALSDSLNEKETFRAEVARVGLSQALKNMKK